MNNLLNTKVMEALKEWKELKEKEGMVATVGLLIEELESEDSDQDISPDGDFNRA